MHQSQHMLLEHIAQRALGPTPPATARAPTAQLRRRDLLTGHLRHRAVIALPRHLREASALRALLAGATVGADAALLRLLLPGTAPQVDPTVQKATAPRSVSLKEHQAGLLDQLPTTAAARVQVLSARSALLPTSTMATASTRVGTLAAAAISLRALRTTHTMPNPCPQATAARTRGHVAHLLSREATLAINLLTLGPTQQAQTQALPPQMQSLSAHAPSSRRFSTPTTRSGKPSTAPTRITPSLRPCASCGRSTSRAAPPTTQATGATRRSSS